MSHYARMHYIIKMFHYPIVLGASLLLRYRIVMGADDILLC